MLAGMSAAAALVALGVAVVSRRRPLAPIATTLAAGLSLVASLLIALGYGGRADVLVLIEAVVVVALIFLTLRQAPGRQALTAVSLAVVAEAVMILVGDGSRGSLEEAAGAAGGVAFWSLGAAGAAGAALHLNALDVDRARSVADARRSQRLELARDLHDFVAHDVSAIVVDAQAGRVVGASAPENALAALERIEEDALRALAAMDRTVQALREADDDASGPAPARTYALEDLSELAGRFETSARAQVRLDVEPEALHGLAQEISATGYRVVVEALTNVRRHAPEAGRVDVAVAPLRATAGPAIAITVSNDGVGAQRVNRRASGFGLIGLRERVEALGGTVTAGPVDRDAGFGLIGLRERVGALGGTVSAGPVNRDGWQLRAVLPHDGAGRAR